MVRIALALGLALIASAASRAEPPTLDPRPAQAAPQPEPDGGAPQSAPAAQSEGPDRLKAVDELLGRLAKTEDPRAAKRIAAAVQALWVRSGSDTVDLLASRANEAQRASKLDVAIKLMDEVVAMKPDYAEGWNRRATLRFAAKDFDEAMGDIHETLIREPRHYGAWLGLGRILSESGFDKRALAAYRKVLEIYPAIEGLKKQVDELALKVEGQPLCVLRDARETRAPQHEDRFWMPKQRLASC